MAYKTPPGAQEAIASARFIRMSPTKARQVVDLIRGHHVDDARRILKFTPRGASPVVGKVLESAIANAEHNSGLPADELVVARAWVDEGPTLKRYRPRAQGRATRIRKRMCHIAVVVGRPDEETLARPAPGEASKTAKQTRRRVRKDTAGKPATRSSATESSEATETAPKKTSKKKTSAKSTAKKTTAKKTTAKKTTKKKATKKKTEGDS